MEIKNHFKKPKFSNVLERNFNLNEDQLKRVFLSAAYQYKVLHFILNTNNKLLYYSGQNAFLQVWTGNPIKPSIQLHKKNYTKIFSGKVLNFTCTILLNQKKYYYYTCINFFSTFYHFSIFHLRAFSKGSKFRFAILAISSTSNKGQSLTGKQRRASARCKNLNFPLKWSQKHNTYTCHLS